MWWMFANPLLNDTRTFGVTWEMAGNLLASSLSSKALCSSTSELAESLITSSSVKPFFISSWASCLLSSEFI